MQDSIEANRNQLEIKKTDLEKIDLDMLSLGVRLYQIEPGSQEWFYLLNQKNSLNQRRQVLVSEIIHLKEENKRLEGQLYGAC